jgi:hypothetical protein
MIVSKEVIKSKFKYKEQLVFSLNKVRPMKKFDQYYIFAENLEIAKYNAWLAQKIYQKDSTILKYWIPEITKEWRFYP